MPPVVVAHRNENPLGPPAAAVRRITEALDSLHRYPSEALAVARRAVARRYGVPDECVLFTRGVDEATDLLVLEAGSSWGAVPGFDGYWERTAALGREFRPIHLDDAWRPATDPEQFAAGGVVLLTNPGNPTGTSLPSDWLRATFASARLTCVDETYIDYASDAQSAIPTAIAADDVCVYVSFSKVYGLAGLRIGALIGAPELLDRLAARQAFLSTDTLALAGVHGAVEDDSFVESSRAFVHDAQRRLVDLLRGAPHLFAEVRPTEAGFVVTRTSRPAGDVAAALRSRGALVHDCAANRLDGWLRISVVADRELDALGVILSDLGAS